jgi:hypothetical protein
MPAPALFWLSQLLPWEISPTGIVSVARNAAAGRVAKPALTK